MTCDSESLLNHFRRYQKKSFFFFPLTTVKGLRPLLCAKIFTGFEQSSLFNLQDLTSLKNYVNWNLQYLLDNLHEFYMLFTWM